MEHKDNVDSTDYFFKNAGMNTMISQASIHVWRKKLEKVKTELVADQSGKCRAKLVVNSNL